LIDDIPLDPSLFAEPKQSKLNKRPFNTQFNGINYQIKPLYKYDLHGIIVSFRHHDGDTGTHKRWGDHINISDVCVVWDEMAASPYLNEMSFWSGQFTCNFSTSNDEVWSHFNADQLSNNHLISDDVIIRNAIQEVKIGDQIHIKGWLSQYVNESGGSRGTSTVRTDSGNGACETIFVNEFEIIRPYNNPWRVAMYTSLGIFILLLIMYFRSPHKAYRK